MSNDHSQDADQENAIHGDSRISDDLPLTYAKCLDGQLTDEEFDKMVESLRTSDRAREEFVSTCLTAGSLFDRFDKDSQGSSAASANVLSVRKMTFGMMGIAAAIAALFVGVWFWGAGTLVDQTNTVAEADQDASRPQREPDIHPTDAEWIAEIVRKIDCVLSDESWAVATQSKLHAGQVIRVERGFIEIRLRNGIVIVLDGPGEFTLTDLRNGVLEYGGLAVRVPKGAEGYVVDTPTARLTDLGTEFAVRVSSRGATRLRVLEGKVAVNERRTDDESLDEVELITEQSTWSSLDRDADSQIDSSNARFLSAGLLSTPDFVKDRQLPVEDDLSLWLSADLAVKADDDGRVVAWGDISAESQSSPKSAWQVDAQRRPKLVRDGISGKPAVRFDGRDDCLITEPWNSGDNQTIFVVARQDRERVIGKVPRSQLINFNGPPHLLMEYRWPDRVLRARSFAGYQHSPYRSGIIDGPSVPQGVPFAVSYVYSYSDNYAELFVNGVSYGSTEALLAIANSSPKIIGMHRRLEEGGFAGDIAEVIIFDRALSTKEIEDLFGYLMNRYRDLRALPAESEIDQDL